MPAWFDRHHVEQCVKLLLEHTNVCDSELLERAMTEYDQIRSKYVPSPNSVLNTSGNTIIPTFAAVLFVSAVDDNFYAEYTSSQTNRPKRIHGALENDVYHILLDSGYKLYRFAAVYDECALLNPT